MHMHKFTFTILPLGAQIVCGTITSRLMLPATLSSLYKLKQALRQVTAQLQRATERTEVSPSHDSRQGSLNGERAMNYPRRETRNTFRPVKNRS